MPGFHVNDIKARLTSLSRAYLFDVHFTKVPKEVDFLKGTDNVTHYLVRSSTLPESAIDPIEVPWQGQTYKIGSTHTFSEWSCTFNVDDAAKILFNMHKWTDLVHDPNTNIQGKPDEYFGQVNLDLVNVKDERIITYELNEIWPSSVGAVDIAQDSKEATTVDVTFQYQWHEIK